MSGVQDPSLSEAIQILTGQIEAIQVGIEQIQTRLYWLETSVQNINSTLNPNPTPTTPPPTQVSSSAFVASAVLTIGEPRQKS